MDEKYPTRSDYLQALNQSLHDYLIKRGYDEGSQLSFQAIYIDLQEFSQLSESQMYAKNRIRQAWDFVRGVVLPWYYTRKTELEIIEDFTAYTWDFHELDSMDPGVSLREILSLI